MNINRYNYEEYFILYMDNELSSDDRRKVEAFVLQHPDLKEELDHLLQYKLSPDNEILFPGKEELIKVNGETPITITNYEEWLVLYTDNELNADQRKEVEKFIDSNSTAKEELVLLQRIKLQPEQFVFADKESLYRKEEKVRALPVRWLRLRQAFGDRRWRIAAAAILLLGIGISTAVILNKKSSGRTDIAKGSGNEKKTNTNNPVIISVIKENIPVNETAVTDDVKQSITPVVKLNTKDNLVKNNKGVIKEKLPANIPFEIKKEEPGFVEKNKPSNNLTLPDNNPNIIKPTNSNDAFAGNNSSNEKNHTEKALATTDVTKPPVETSPPKNPEVIYASLEEGGKNKKNRGFLRKLARTFEKRTSIPATDDDRLLVGAFAFKLN